MLDFNQEAPRNTTKFSRQSSLPITVWFVKGAEAHDETYRCRKPLFTGKCLLAMNNPVTVPLIPICKTSFGQSASKRTHIFISFDSQSSFSKYLDMPSNNLAKQWCSLLHLQQNPILTSIHNFAKYRNLTSFIHLHPTIWAKIGNFYTWIAQMVSPPIWGNPPPLGGFFGRYQMGPSDANPPPTWPPA